MQKIKFNKKESKKFINKTSYRDKEIVLILENIQYARNVAAIFRTADAAGVSKIFLTGISKTPPFGKELMQVSRSREKFLTWEYFESSGQAIKKLKENGFKIVGIELAHNSIMLENLKSALKNVDKVCFVAGSEVFGVKESTLNECDNTVIIPMYGKGISLNVSTSVGVVLYSF